MCIRDRTETETERQTHRDTETETHRETETETQREERERDKQADREAVDLRTEFNINGKNLHSVEGKDKRTFTENKKEKGGGYLTIPA